MAKCLNCNCEIPDGKNFCDPYCKDAYTRRIFQKVEQ